jgi:hypothetical protein
MLLHMAWHIPSRGFVLLVLVLPGCGDDGARTPEDTGTTAASADGPDDDGGMSMTTSMPGGDSTGVETTGDTGTSSGDASSGTGDEDDGGTSSSTTDDGGSESSGGTGDDGPPDPVVVIDCSDLAAGPILGGEPIGELGFPPPCSPRTPNTSPDFTCCSDDPAAIGGALPDYEGQGIDGDTPWFSGVNNGLGTWGACVDTSLLPAGNGLMESGVENCPVPCDPTWNDGDVATVCGVAAQCCQTQPLRPEDCVLDPDSGDWRPADGTDIPSLTDWNPAAHQTHQDPGGVGCLAAAGGDSMSAVFVDCVENLHVAHRRGFCMVLGAGQTCPHEAEGYLDACEMINMGLIDPPR